VDISSATKKHNYSGRKMRNVRADDYYRNSVELFSIGMNKNGQFGLALTFE